MQCNRKQLNSQSMLKNIACNTVQMFCIFAYCQLWCMVVCHSTHRPIYLRTKNQKTKHTHTLICRTFERKHTKTLKRQRGKYMIPQSSNCLSFRIFTSNTMWFDWCRSLHVLWMGFLLLFFLSESYSNRLQHMPNAYVYKSIQFQFYRLVACARYCTIFTYTHIYT